MNQKEGATAPAPYGRLIKLIVVLASLALALGFISTKLGLRWLGIVGWVMMLLAVAIGFYIVFLETVELIRLFSGRKR